MLMLYYLYHRKLIAIITFLHAFNNEINTEIDRLIIVKYSLKY